MRVRSAIAGAIGAGFLLIALCKEAPARPCFENGAIVSFDGIASRGAAAGGARDPGWVLNLTRPICVLRNSRSASTAGSNPISAIRIVGTPPPPGVPLALTGKLLIGPSDSAMFVALVVTRGRKLGTVALAPAPNSAGHETKTADERCDGPPYGGTAAEFQGFVRRFGNVVTPTRMLAGICNAKFGHATRAGLHKLGFTDARIESESTERLAADTIVALKSLVNTIE